MTEVLLETRNLGISMGRRQLVSELNLQVHPGSCWGILGPNGAGKTTLLHTFGGLLSPDTGSIRLHGKPLQSYSTKALARQRGLLLQSYDSGFPGTLFESVLRGRHPHLGRFGWETPEDLQLAADAMEMAGLKGFEERLVDTLSGGERQRMEIATLLAQHPRLALLDEPSNHLDPGQQILMLNLLQKTFAAENHAMIMVLHDINLATRFCDHLLLLRGNGEYQAGPVPEMASEACISWLYQHPVSRHQVGGQLYFQFL